MPAPDDQVQSAAQDGEHYPQLKDVINCYEVAVDQHEMAALDDL
jgi:hypothetical protein